MKILIASDIHGSGYYCERLVERFSEEKSDRLILLGDILYHGPRNDLPREYDPKKVISLLGPLSDRIFCIKGNCDSEVDGMVLKFPIESDFAAIFAGEHMMYLTHGHKIRDDHKSMNCILINGHTHVPIAEKNEGLIHLNPGSVSIPKENSPHSYMTFDGKTFLWKNVETGEVYKELSL